MYRIFAVIGPALLLSAPAYSAGFEYPENGARALARGGAFVASGDDPTLIQHNPAGLAGLDGLRISLDGQFVWWTTEYQRLVQDNAGDWTAVDPSSGETMLPVGNTRNPWITPFLAATYQVIDGLTLGLGVYGPSAVGERRYPDPRDIAPFFWDGEYHEGEEDLDAVQKGIPRRSPQRYGLIRLFNLVFFPTASVGWEPVSWLRLGVSAQLVSSNMEYSLAFQSDTIATLVGPGPESDVVGELDVATRSLGKTAIFGVQAKPIDPLTIGLTFRPPFSLEQEGTFRLYFNDLQRDMGLRQDLDRAVFKSNFPAVFRLGVAWEQAGWVAEMTGSYETLSVVDVYVFEPDISIDVPLAEPIEVRGEEVLMDKQWEDTFGLRLGGGVDLERAFGLPVPVELFAGYAFEHAAIPTRTQNLDFFSPTRHQLAFGFSYDTGPARISTSFSQTLEPTVQVRDSIVFRVDDASLGLDPDADLKMVMNGDYQSRHSLFMLSVESRFGAP